MRFSRKIEANLKKLFAPKMNADDSETLFLARYRLCYLLCYSSYTVKFVLMPNWFGRRGHFRPPFDPPYQLIELIILTD